MGNLDLILLTNGLYLQGLYGSRLGFASVSPVSIPENTPLLHMTSIQQCELMLLTLTRACYLTQGNFLNIYTDSYTFVVAHDFHLISK